MFKLDVEKYIKKRKLLLGKVGFYAIFLFLILIVLGQYSIVQLTHHNYIGFIIITILLLLNYTYLMIPALQIMQKIMRLDNKNIVAEGMEDTIQGILDRWERE